MGVENLTGNDARQISSRDERFAAANDNIAKKIRGNSVNSDIVAPIIEDPASAKFGAIATGNNDSLAPAPESDDTAPAIVETVALDEVNSDAIAPSNTDEIVTTKADIAALLQKKEDAVKAELEAKYKADLDQARADAAAVNSRKQNLEDLFAIGNPKGNVHPVTNPNTADISGGGIRRSEPTGLKLKTFGGAVMTVVGDGSPKMREFDSLVGASLRNGCRVTDRSMSVSIQRDTRALDAFYRKHRQEINDGIEAIAKNLGLLQGANTRIGSDAISSVADIPSVMFEVLSSFIRTNQYADLIHWQFATTEFRSGVEVGMQMKIPRYNYLPRPSVRADRELTQGTRITSSSVPVTQDNRLVTIKELGRGKAGVSGAEPIGFSTFVEAFSMADLESIIELNLGYDYAYTKDLFLRGELFRTNYVVYNNSGNVSTTPSFTPGSDRASGTITEAFINNLVAEAYSLEIAPFRDGCYGLLLNPKAWAQFMNEKSEKERDIALRDGDLVSTSLRRRAESETYGGQVSGYCGTFNGVHVFKQNVYGKGSTAGTDEGVYSTAFTGGNQITRTSFLIGRETIGWGTALPAEIRFDEVDDFRRERRAIWYSHENSASLDVRNTVSEVDATRFEEQLRVIEIRSTESPLVP